MQDRFARYHERVRAREAAWPYDLAWWVVVRPALLAYRVRAIDASSVPADGPLILAPNHESFLDHFLLAGLSGRRLSYMANARLFKGPLALMSHLGAFPVRQAARDGEAFVTAHAVLERGGCLVLYSEGGLGRDGSLLERAKPGIGRLALESGVPVVPVAIFGAHRIQRLRFPTVTVRFGPPLRFGRVARPSRGCQHLAADEVFAEIRRLHDGLAAEGHREARRRGATTGAWWAPRPR